MLNNLEMQSNIKVIIYIYQSCSGAIGVQYLAQGQYDVQSRESNQPPSDNKTLALSVSHSRKY